MQGVKVSTFQRFVVITLSLIILGVLLAAGVVVFAIGLLLVPLFLLLNRNKAKFVRRNREQEAIEAEFERVD